jgi:hypothetical protein
MPHGQTHCVSLSVFCTTIAPQSSRTGIERVEIRQRQLAVLPIFGTKSGRNMAGVHGSRTHLGTQWCAPTTVLKTVRTPEKVDFDQCVG